MGIRKIKLPQRVIACAPGLLPMLYTPREIGEELGVASSTLRDWLDGGAPHERDARGRIWINGQSFAAWVKSHQKPRKTTRLKSDQAFCFHCKQITQLEAPEVRLIQGQLIHRSGTCSHCGHTITRGDRHARTAELPQR